MSTSSVRATVAVLAYESGLVVAGGRDAGH
jgi:hypothetical protein